MIELIQTGGANVLKKLIEILKHRKKKGGIVVLLTRSYKSVEKELLDANINPNSFKFIDVVGDSRSSNSICITKGSLTGLSIAITETLQSLPDESKFVVFDSLNPLTLYNKTPVIIKFMMFLIEKFRSWNVSATFILSKEGASPQFSSLLESSVDKITA